MKEETASSLEAIDVGALTTFRTFARSNRRKMMVVHLDQLAPYERAAQHGGLKEGSVGAVGE
jgi:hypothetical protein